VRMERGGGLGQGEGSYSPRSSSVSVARNCSAIVDGSAGAAGGVSMRGVEGGEVGETGGSRKPPMLLPPLLLPYVMGLELPRHLAVWETLRLGGGGGGGGGGEGEGGGGGGVEGGKREMKARKEVVYLRVSCKTRGRARVLCAQRVAHELGTCIQFVHPSWSYVEWHSKASRDRGEEGRGGRERDGAEGGDAGAGEEEEVVELVVHINDAGLVAGIALSPRPLSDREFHSRSRVCVWGGGEGIEAQEQAVVRWGGRRG